MRNRNADKSEEPENPQENNPASPFASLEAALRNEIESTDSPDAPPRRRRRSTRPTIELHWGFIFRSLLAVAIFAGLLILIWALLLGPLVPVKETLVNRVNAFLATPIHPTAGPTFTPAPPKPTRTPRPTYAVWTDTPQPSPSETLNTIASLPTSTSIVQSTEILPTETPLPSPTPSVSGCVPVEQVTAADIGKTLCVTGRVYKTKQAENQGLNTFSVLLLNSQGFLFVSYERSWSLKEGTCVYATGEIKALGGATTILLSYAVPLQFCNP